MAVENILDEFENKKSEKLSEIKKINSQISSLEKRTIKKLASSLIEENIDIQSEILLKTFSEENILFLFNEVVKVRGLRISEIEPHFLNILERLSYRKPNNKTFKSFYKEFVSVFEDLSNELKLKIATFCSGTCTISQSIPEIQEWLYNNYNLQKHFEGKNSIYFNGYNHENYSATLQIALIKNEKEGLKEIKDAIISLRNDNFLMKSIDIFEHTCSASTSYYIDINEKTTMPEIYRGRWSDNITFEGDFEERLDKILDYCSQNLWYESNEEEEEDNEYSYL